MARPNKPLNAYPTELRQMAEAAASSQSLFPISLPFDNATKAMAFRVLFYSYRRTLRSHLAHNEDKGLDLPTSLIIEAQGAELISSPRIVSRDAATPTAPDQTYCVFALSASQPSTQQGISTLASILAATQPDSAPPFEDPAEADAYANPPKPPTDIDHIAARKTKPKSAAPCRTLIIKDIPHTIPIDDIDETHQELTDTKLALLYANKLAAPAFPLHTYKD